jgi:predicted metalloprotease with PDZ domain
MFIRKNSNNKYSLDDLMRYLNTEFALKNKGYSDVDYQLAVEHFAGASYDDIFDNYINGITDYTSLLTDAMNYIGCELVFTSANRFNEHALGIKVQEIGGVCKVMAVYPNSVADKGGIMINDDILLVNTIQLKPDGFAAAFTGWCNYFFQKDAVTPIQLTFSTNGITKQAQLLAQPNAYYKIVQMKKQATATEQQKTNFEVWSKNKF